jgi:hypothetical protein
MTEIIYIRNNKASREDEDALLRWAGIHEPVTGKLRERMIQEIWKFFDELIAEQQGDKANE